MDPWVEDKWLDGGVQVGLSAVIDRLIKTSTPPQWPQGV